MDTFIQNQYHFVHLFSSLHKPTNDNDSVTPFLTRVQHLLMNLKRAIMTPGQTAMVQQYQFAILTLLYKLIPYTRDVYGGLGERDLTYQMLFIWNYHFPVPVATCLHQLVLPIQFNPPYGSWRDIRGLCQFVRSHSEKGEQDPFIETCIGMMNHQLDADLKAWDNALDEFNRKQNTMAEIPRPNAVSAGLSLVCKWIPREHGKFHWLFIRCAIQYIRAFQPHYFKFCKNDSQFQAALRKGAKEYRRAFARLSRVWNVLETKQCALQWDTIQHSDIPFIAGHRQQQALLNIGLSGNVRTQTMQDNSRKLCAEKHKLHWATNAAYKSHHLDKVNPLFLDMGSLVKTALRVSQGDEVKRLETQWKHLLEQCSDLGTTIPILDTSLFSISNDRFYEGLGLALYVSALTNHRLFLFDQTCHFLSLENEKQLRAMLQRVKPIYHEHHIGRDFQLVCKRLIASIQDSQLPEEEVGQLRLAFFTHWQSESEIEAIRETIRNCFATAGYKTCPFLLFWRGGNNMTADGNTQLALEPEKMAEKMARTFYFSGNTNYIWTRLSKLQDCHWKSMNAFDLVAYLLNHERYAPFDSYFKTLLQPSAAKPTTT